jgi:hypothetical protein
VFYLCTTFFHFIVNPIFSLLFQSIPVSFCLLYVLFSSYFNKSCFYPFFHSFSFLSLYFIFCTHILSLLSLSPFLPTISLLHSLSPSPLLPLVSLLYSSPFSLHLLLPVLYLLFLPPPIYVSFPFYALSIENPAKPDTTALIEYNTVRLHCPCMAVFGVASFLCGKIDAAPRAVVSVSAHT